MDAQELAAQALAGDLQADRLLTIEAAAGSVDAQRALLVGLLATSEQTYGTMLRLELLARFVALRGDNEDRRRFAGLLWCLATKGRELGFAEEADAAAAESATLLIAMADGGDGMASEATGELAAQFPESWQHAEAAAGRNGEVA